MRSCIINMWFVSSCQIRCKYNDAYILVTLLMISQHFYCIPLWFTNDSLQGQFSSKFINHCIYSKDIGKDENRNNLWGLFCPSVRIFTTLADAKNFVFAERQIFLPWRIHFWLRTICVLTSWKMTKCYNIS